MKKSATKKNLHQSSLQHQCDTQFEIVGYIEIVVYIPKTPTASNETPDGHS